MILCIEYSGTPRIIRTVRTKGCVCVVFLRFVHWITLANPIYILIRMCTTPVKESHVVVNRTAQIWRSVPKNILVTASRELHARGTWIAWDLPCTRSSQSTEVTKARTSEVRLRGSDVYLKSSVESSELGLLRKELWCFKSSTRYLVFFR